MKILVNRVGRWEYAFVDPYGIMACNWLGYPDPDGLAKIIIPLLPVSSFWQSWFSLLGYLTEITWPHISLILRMTMDAISAIFLTLVLVLVFPTWVRTHMTYTRGLLLYGAHCWGQPYNKMTRFHDITLSGAGIMTLMTIVKTVDSVMSSPDIADPCNSWYVSLPISLCLTHEVVGSVLSLGISVGSFPHLYEWLMRLGMHAHHM